MPHDDESSFKFLTENSADMIFRSDFTPQFTYVSPSSLRLLGWHPDELLGRGPEAAVYAEDLPHVAQHIAGLHTGEDIPNLSVRMFHKNGSLVWMEVSGRMIRDRESGEPRELILVARDITERKQFEEQLLAEKAALHSKAEQISPPESDENSFRFLTENSSDMIFRSDFSPRITYASPSSIRLLGWTPEELLGVGPEFLVYPHDLATVDHHVNILRNLGEDAIGPTLTVRMRHKENRLVWVEMGVKMIADPDTGAPLEMICTARDVTDRKHLEDQLLAMAMTDGLTGLLNRRAFDTELDREWARVLREGSQLSLVLLDIDHFKKFNDEYGHLAGDDCLRVVSAAVRTAVRSTDMVARYGGEELAIILPGTDFAGAHIVAEMARTAIEDLRIPHDKNAEGGYRVTASLGVGTALARVGAGIRMPESLVLSADKALYMAKHEGRNCVRKIMMMAASSRLSEVA